MGGNASALRSIEDEIAGIRDELHELKVVNTELQKAVEELEGKFDELEDENHRQSLGGFGYGQQQPQVQILVDDMSGGEEKADPKEQKKENGKKDRSWKRLKRSSHKKSESQSKEEKKEAEVGVDVNSMDESKKSLKDADSPKLKGRSVDDKKLDPEGLEMTAVREMLPPSDNTPLIPIPEQFRKGMSLMKVPRSGKAKPCKFFLTQNDDRDFVIRWESKKKKLAETTAILKECRLIQGQKTKVFEKHSDLKRFAHLSFSIISPDRTIDVYTKTESNYQMWTLTLLKYCKKDRRASLSLSRKQALNRQGSSAGMQTGRPSVQNRHDSPASRARNRPNSLAANANRAQSRVAV